MIGTKQRPGVNLIGVTDSDLDDMQAIIDEANGNFTKNQSVKDMLATAASSSNRFVDLVEEGWHQLETLRGKKWLHITLFYSGNKYHCYAPVSGISDKPKAGTHKIESISYVSFSSPGRSSLIEVLRDS